MITQPIAFDPFNISLQGVNFIEASAGTGKTYGIASIYARLIVLENKNIDEILVVTFTKAAAAELRQRLRNRLIEIKNMLLQEQISDEPFMQQLYQQIQKTKQPKSLIIKHLFQQLTRFDKATIYTIHQFCRTILIDEAFLSGNPFNLNLVSNHEKAIRTMTEDFFREHITPYYEKSLFFFQEKITPKFLINKNRQHFQKPLSDKYFLSEDKQKLYQKILLNLYQSLNDIPKFLDNNEALVKKLLGIIEKKKIKGNYFKLETYQSLFIKLKLSPSTILSALNKEKYGDALKRIMHFDEKYIKKALADTDKQEIKQLFQQLQQLEPLNSLMNYYEDYKKEKDKMLNSCYLYFVKYIDKRIEDYKKLTLERSFDDLLVDVWSVLESNTSHTQQLIKNLTHQYHYVLVDEFQDTDAIQYAIFQKLFIQQNTPVYCIGDPKQSIYKFRGADIESYLKAKNDTTHSYSMNTNYRSVVSLITVINKIFTSHDNPFKMESISYFPVEAHRNLAKIQLKNDGLIPPSLIWFKAALTLVKLNSKAENKTRLRKIAARATADYIAQLLNTAQQELIEYEQHELEAKNIAILVSKHEQAKIVSEALLDKNIRSVRYTQESIYKTQEAKILLTLLKFCRKLNYQIEIEANFEDNYSELNYLLSSPLWRASAKEIQHIQNTKEELKKYLQKCKTFFEIWEKDGIYSAFQFLSQQTGFENKLIEQQQERTLTSFNHLIELLSAQQKIQFQDSYSLINWLEEQIQASDTPTEENLLRLESDENLVKIITIHASKGLQYPIVFCPFLWDLEWELKDDQQSQDNNENSKDTSNEEAQETLRLLYVAITRAEEKLILFTNDGEKNEKKVNPLQYLMKNYLKESESLWGAWKKWYEVNPELHHIVSLQENLPKQTIFKLKQTTNQTLIAVKKPAFKHTLTETTSYSKLVKKLETIAPVNTKKIVPNIESLEINKTTPLSILNFPKGPKMGNYWHEVLELINFQKSLSKQQALIKQKILQYNISTYGFTDEEIIEVTLKTLENVLQAPLNNGVTIQSFPLEKTRQELEFMIYQTNNFSLKAIDQWFEKYHWQNLCSSLPLYDQENIYQTYLSGFIDWVGLDSQQNLYIIDYKSNFLGSDQQNYQPDKLVNEILKYSYQFQSTIYALAMHRYFKSISQPIKHIYIRYLFLRGLEKNSEHGIWKWNIHAQSLDDLETLLAQKVT